MTHQITQDQLDARADTLVRTEVFYCVSQLISELIKDDKYIDALAQVMYQEDDDGNEVEAYEHWLISDYLADKLEAKGEMVLRDFLGLTIWGRTTTGQAISMDYVIQSVAKDLLHP